MTTPPDRAVVIDGSTDDAAILGGKGGALGRLVGWGLQVPESGAVTTSAYRELAATGEIVALVERIRGGEQVPTDEVDACFLRARFTDETAAEILRVASVVGGDAHLAVRSSATVEDLAGSSFAGQYRSLLDVDPDDADAVLDAVRLVFASLWHPAPCAYRAAFGIDDAGVAMAAVLMRMVDARHAGVVFTVDPGGEPGAARVEAVQGLGESLVSGQRTPDAWVVPRESAAGSDHLLPEHASQALSAALVVEERAGTPQDVEWAWADGVLWVVQARPITVTAAATGDGFDTPTDDAELTTAGIGEMLPGVLPPLRWQLASHLVEEAFRRMAADLGVADGTGDAPFVRRVHGRAAMDLDALRRIADRLPGGSADELERQYFGSRRPGRPAAPADVSHSRLELLRHDLRSLVVRRRTALDAETVIHAVQQLEPSADLAGRSVDSLVRYLQRLLDLATRAASAELTTSATATAAYRKVELLLTPHIGAGEAGRWAELVTRRGIAVTPRASASAAVFAGPSWDELGVAPPVRDAGRSQPDAEGSDLAALLAELRGHPSFGSEGLRTALRIRGLTQMIEESVVLLHRREAVKAALLWLGGEVRRVLLELGSRLVDAGALDDPSDIEFISLAELYESLAGRPVAPRFLALRRRWCRRYEAEPPLPARFRGEPEAEAVELPVDGRMEGWAASGGRWSGRAQAVADPRGDFETGRVLVAAATDASWSPLFARAAAIVVERGGPLSHAAILARELGVPAVLNVPGATEALDGREVTVDGDTGVVFVHDEVGTDS